MTSLGYKDPYSSYILGELFYPPFTCLNASFQRGVGIKCALSDIPHAVCLELYLVGMLQWSETDFTASRGT